MGYGPVVGGKQLPISNWKGSWAQQEQEKRLNPKPKEYHSPSCNKRLYPHHFPGKPCNCKAA
jgi:hypothetical protein